MYLLLLYLVQGEIKMDILFLKIVGFLVVIGLCAFFLYLINISDKERENVCTSRGLKYVGANSNYIFCAKVNKDGEVLEKKQYYRW